MTDRRAGRGRRGAASWPAYIVHQAVTSRAAGDGEFAPDGGWAEGPGYWNYATSYNVYMLAALD